MERVSGTGPAGKQPRELGIWVGQSEPRLHLWIHPQEGRGGIEMRVNESEVKEALERALAAGAETPQRDAPGSLMEYFQDGNWRLALRRYAQFADESAWSVAYRLELYNHAKIAFDPALGDEIREASFAQVYESLRACWQVFRNASTRWDEEAAFLVFSQLGDECGQSSVRSLENLSRAEMKAVIQSFLEKFNDIKTVPEGGYPTMTASRFLHFYNPRLFPNLDLALINQQVLQVFGPEFDKYCLDTGIAEWEHEAAFYEQYMLWAGKHIQMADAEFFSDFETWFKAQVEGEEDPNGVLEEIGKYHATAFEYVAIGAAKLQIEG